MKRKLIRLLQCVHSQISGTCHKGDYQKTIVICFFGKIGDMVMFLDALEGYGRLYSDYRLVLACRDEVWSFLAQIGYAENWDFFELDREHLLASFSYYMDRVKNMKKIKASKFIHVRENAGVEHVFLHAVPAEEKIVYRSYGINLSGIMKYFSLRTYSSDFKGRDDMDQLTSYADLLRKLGLSDFKSSIPLLPAVGRNDLLEPKTYICICPGASMPNKCWPVARYAEVINYIFRKTDYYVALCGGKTEIPVSGGIIENLDNTSRMVDFTGKTTIEDWIGIIRNAKLVVTNESGAAHVAASSRVPSVCIGEQKYSNKWLPYRPEIVTAEDCAPVIVRGPVLECGFCAKRNFQKDASCKRCIKQTGVVRCVYEVKVVNVIEAIDDALGRP